MKRRDFIKYSACGLTALAVGSRLNLPPFFNTQAHAATVSVDLGMAVADVEMIDGKFIPHWLFTVDGAPTFPGPVIFYLNDSVDTLEINVTNGLADMSREVVIVGTTKTTGPIGANSTGTITISPGDLAPGTYLYKDATLDPLSRVLGLHGALIVLPSAEATNPYGSFSTTNVTNLFNDLGDWPTNDLLNPNALFPGQPWFATTDANPAYPDTDSTDPLTNPLTLAAFANESDYHHYRDYRVNATGPQSAAFERFLYRTRIWLHSAIDPMLNDHVITMNNLPGNAAEAETMVLNSMPQYFTINGRSGAYGGHSYDVMAISTIGEPHVIRLLNAGMATHSPHIHANHVFILAVNNVVGNGGDAFGPASADLGDNLMFVDTMTLRPEDTVDWLLPYIRPPDIPLVADDGTILRPGQATDKKLMPLQDLIPQELNTVLIEPQNPLAYPMHSHMELDQTAAGGNYPQGTIAMWEIEGEFGDEFHPDPVPEAPTRPRGRGRGRGGGQG